MGRKMKNSVEPHPRPLARFFAIADFPFCIQGVIFAQSKSPSLNFVKPEACSIVVSSIVVISENVSSITSIGTNEMGVSAVLPL